jgi:hypothetical protein
LNLATPLLAGLLLNFALTAHAIPPAPPGNTAQACAAMVKSQTEAITKADWIVEADVTSGFIPSDYSYRSISLEKITVLKKAWDLRKVHTLEPMIGPCFAEGKGVAAGGKLEKFIGKRMRVYGSRHWDGHSRRAFYIEDVTNRFAGLPPAAALSTENKLHRNAATNPLPNGWHRARSTDGNYSIEVPAPFIDATATVAGVRGAVIRTVDATGMTFVATREASTPEPELARTFDTEYEAFPARRIQFKGVPALTYRIFRDDRVFHSIMFRVPGGTFALGVEAKKNNEDEALAVRERFFNSIVFE